MFYKVSVALLISAAFAAAQTAIISGLNPTNTPMGSPATPLTITGQNMTAGSTVSWTTPNGQTVTLSPQLIDAAQLAATIPAALLTTAGTAQVAVADPTGVLSNQLPFNISLASMAVTAAALPDGTSGTAYGPVTLAATGGTTPYTWTLSGGSLPGGLGLDPTGVLSGTPTSPGTYAFGVRATDASGAKATGSFSIKINPSGFKITTPATLPPGIAGSEYPSQILSATGGTAPYTFAITGSLPSGLTFSNGEIDGTPLSAGTSNFTLTATDSASPPLSLSIPVQITIRPSTTVDLTVGGNSAVFSLSTSSTGLPPATVIPVTSSSPTQAIGYSTTVSPAVPWLTVSSGTTTPGSINIALSSAALSLAASSTPYQTSVIVTCAAASPCASSAPQNIGVSVSVTSPAPQLSATPALLTFAGSVASPPAPQTLSVQNTGGGSLQIVSITAADKWVGIGSFPSSLAGGPAVPIVITADPTGLDPGFYKSAVNVVTSSGQSSIAVTLSVSGSASMTLAPAGAQFTMGAGGVLGNANGSFLVNFFAGSAAAFTASVQPGATWLSITQQSGGAVSFAIDPAIAAGLAAGTYYGTIRVASSGVVNSPQDFQVILFIAPAATAVRPDPQPAGLVFAASGSTAPPGQTVKVFASSATPVPYQASANTSDGRTWLSVTPATGTTSASSAAATTVNVNPAGLAAGIYRGGVNYEYAGSSVRTVNVTFIVPPGSGATPSAVTSSGRLSISAAAPGCVPAQLVPAPTGPTTNFATPASWPSALAVNLLNDCGGVVTNGQISTTFSNGDPPLALTLVDSTTGLYSGTWTPRGTSSQVTITASASAPGYAVAKALISGQVKPNIAPAIAPNSVLQIFDPEIGGALAPGNVIQIYGTNLASQTASPALPLPSNVEGTSVLIGGIQSPLFYVGPGQVNAQVPFELAAGKQYQVIVNANGALSTPASIQLSSVAPGILPYPATAQLVAQRPDGSLVSEASPAKPGDLLVLYLAGMGLTNPAVTTGSGSPGLAVTDTLAQPQAAPTLTLDGAPVTINFAGLTPGLVGLYQVNFQVPADAQDGDREVILTQSGTAANKTLLPVHH